MADEASLIAHLQRIRKTAKAGQEDLHFSLREDGPLAPAAQAAFEMVACCAALRDGRRACACNVTQHGGPPDANPVWCTANRPHGRARPPSEQASAGGHIGGYGCRAAPASHATNNWRAHDRNRRQNAYIRNKGNRTLYAPHAAQFAW